MSSKLHTNLLAICHRCQSIKYGLASQKPQYSSVVRASDWVIGPTPFLFQVSWSCLITWLILTHILLFIITLKQSKWFVFIGKQEAAEATLEALKVVPEPLGKWASILVEICAYAGK